MNDKNNSGDYNSGDYNSGDFNSGYCNSGDCNSGDYNSGYRNSGSKNSGDCNSGNCNSGDCNFGNYNSGLFNTDTPTVRCFNKETGIKRAYFKFPDMAEFKLTEFKNGKLINYDYKEAWKNFWNSISEDRKQEFLNLPNFDAKIFEEITGIKVEISKKQQLKNLISQIKYLKTNMNQEQEKINSLIKLIHSEEFNEVKLEEL